MRIVLPILCLALLLAASSVTHAAPPTQEQLRAAAQQAGSVNGLCPVTRELVTPAGDTVTFKGERIGFQAPEAAPQAGELR